MVPFHLSTAKWGKKTEAVETQGQVKNIPFLFFYPVYMDR